jgi:hypothetical protein
MPRPAAELETAPFVIASPTLPPPADLTEEQAADWRAITSQFESDWFDAGNAPLLTELVRHLSYARQLSEALEAMRRRPLTSTTAKGAKGRPTYRQLLAMQRAESQVISMLSVKLRLSNSAHRTNDPRRGRGDGRLAATVPSGPKPWEQ